jgi:hypothetical protein
LDENGTEATLNQTRPNANLIARRDPLALPEVFTASLGDDGPTDAHLRLFHRGPSGFIPLAVKRDGKKWEELGAIAVGQPLLPGLLQQLAKDGYFGLNTSFRAGAKYNPVQRERWVPIPGERYGGNGTYPAEQLIGVTEWKQQLVHPKTKLSFAPTGKKTLRWLNAAYVDLDCYKLGFSVGDTIGALIDMQDAGTLPPVSVLARSGRGVWAFWLLLDPKNPKEGEQLIYEQPHTPLTPARATAHALGLYARVQNAIVRRLSHLGADLGAVDGPRYAPFAGTVKTGSDQRVLYWAQATSKGLPYYALPELLTAFGEPLVWTEHAVIRRALTTQPDEAKRTRCRNAWHKRHEYMVRDLELLLRLRRGRWNRRTSRNRFAFYYAYALKRAGMTRTEVADRVAFFGAEVGLERDEVKAAVKSGCKTGYRNIRRQTYLTELLANDAELSYLDANRRGDAPTGSGESGTSRAHMQERRAAILSAIHEVFKGKPPSCRAMEAFLTAQGVPCGNYSTIALDYKALGLKTTAKAGRPPKLPL